MRKRFYGIVLALLTASMLAGCGGAKDVTKQSDAIAEAGKTTSEKQTKVKTDVAVDKLKTYYVDFCKEHYMENNDLAARFQASDGVNLDAVSTLQLLKEMDCAAKLFLLDGKWTMVIADLKDYQNYHFLMDFYVVSTDGKNVTEDIVIPNCGTLMTIGLFAKGNTLYFTSIDCLGSMDNSSIYAYAFSVENGTKKDIANYPFNDKYYEPGYAQYVNKSIQKAKDMKAANDVTFISDVSYEDYDYVAKNYLGVLSSNTFANEGEMLEQLGFVSFDDDYRINLVNALYDYRDVDSQKAGLSNDEFTAFLDRIKDASISTNLELQLAYGDYLADKGIDLNPDYEKGFALTYWQDGVYYYIGSKKWMSDELSMSSAINYIDYNNRSDSGMGETAWDSGMRIDIQWYPNDLETLDGEYYAIAIAADEIKDGSVESLGGIPVGFGKYPNGMQEALRKQWDEDNNDERKDEVILGRILKGVKMSTWSFTYGVPAGGVRVMILEDCLDYEGNVNIDTINSIFNSLRNIPGVGNGFDFLTEMRSEKYKNIIMLDFSISEDNKVKMDVISKNDEIIWSKTE